MYLIYDLKCILYYYNMYLPFSVLHSRQQNIICNNMFQLYNLQNTMKFLYNFTHFGNKNQISAFTIHILS